jgi:GDP-4-dehydro-6-deoxy-D-mannose reductase
MNCPEPLTLALKRHRPHIIIHLASGLRDDAPEALVNTNVVGTIRLFEAMACARISPGNVVLGSTGGVYGAPPSLPLDEMLPCAPIDPYSVTKLAAEQMARTLARRYDLPLICARLFNLVGPGQDERHICGRFVSQAVAISSGLAEPVMSVESLDTTRDFIDVRDVGAGLYILSKSGTPGGIYNVANGCEVPVRVILDLTLNAAKVNNLVSIRHAGARPADIPRHVASTIRLRSLGYQSRYSLQSSINDLVAYYQNDVAAAAGFIGGRTVHVA